MGSFRKIGVKPQRRRDAELPVFPSPCNDVTNHSFNDPQVGFVSQKMLEDELHKSQIVLLAPWMGVEWLRFVISENFEP